MITPEQLEARTRSLGSSDAAILAGVDGPGNRTLLDLWASKRRGPELELEPLQPPEPPAESAFEVLRGVDVTIDPRLVGNVLETAVVALYESATGAKTKRRRTLNRRDLPWASANPDRIIVGQQAGLEAKLVGRWGAPRWEGDGVPEHVALQCHWSMAVWPRARHWDVVAWIAGTEVRIARIERDDDICRTLLELGERFWTEHVLANVPPSPIDAADMCRMVRRRWPRDNGEIIDCPEAAQWADKLTKLGRAEERLKTLKDAATAELVALVGPHKGIAWDGGKYLYATAAGRVSWKNVATDLAGGVVSDDVLDKHRGAPYRKGRLSLARGSKK